MATTVVLTGKFLPEPEAMDINGSLVYLWRLEENCWNKTDGRYTVVWHVYLSERASNWLSKKDLKFRYVVTGTDFRIMMHDVQSRKEIVPIPTLVYPSVGTL